MTDITLPYEPQARQALMHASNARMILYGGAAGGGKSHSLRYDAIAHCLKNPGLRAYLFRRTFKELEDNHILPMQADMPGQLGVYIEGKKRFDFVNGSKLHFCYCENEGDVTRYQGAEFHWLGIDEATHLTEYQLRYLITRLRLGGYNPQEKHLPRAVLASNPGGPGHNFLKLKFVDAAPAEEVFIDEEWGFRSIFIPAKMSDNRYLDQEYGRQFTGLAPELVDALVQGDWDAIVGKALHSLNRRDHMLPQFNVPKHWTRFQVIDFGTAKPFSVGWWAVSDGAFHKRADRWIPSGALVRYDEWYGWNGKANHGCRMESPLVAKGILEREAQRGDVMDYRVGDSEMWAQHDGPSVAERMIRFDARLSMRKSKKDRKMGYTEILARLKGIEADDSDVWLPMLYATDNCRHFWRTMTTLTLDPVDAEKGPATNLEDHVYDEVSYACRSRPFVTTELDRYEDEFGDEIRRARGRGIDPYATA